MALFPFPVLAAPIPPRADVSDVPVLADLVGVITNLINALFLFVGAVTVIFLLYGAIKFIISRGDPKAIESAQKTMTYAIIGAALIVLSFVILNIVATALGLPAATFQKFGFSQ